MGDPDAVKFGRSPPVGGTGPTGDLPRIARRDQCPADRPADLPQTDDGDAHAREYVSRVVGAAILVADRATGFSSAGERVER